MQIVYFTIKAAMIVGTTTNAHRATVSTIDGRVVNSFIATASRPLASSALFL